MDTPLNPTEPTSAKDESGKKVYRKRNARKGNNLLGSNHGKRDSGTNFSKLHSGESGIKLSDESVDDGYLDPIGVIDLIRESRERHGQVTTREVACCSHDSRVGSPVAVYRSSHAGN